MEKLITVHCIQKEQTDPDSITTTLHFDGIANAENVMKLLEARLQADTQVNWKDVGGVMIAIYVENNKRRRRNKEAEAE